MDYNRRNKMYKDKNMPKLSRKKTDVSSDTLIWIVTIFLAVLFLAVGFLEYFNDYKIIPASSSVTYVNPSTGKSQTVSPIFGLVSVPTGAQGIIPNALNLSVHDWIAMSLIILIGIPSFAIYFRNERRLKAIDDNLPFLLREIADSQRIGMHLPRAIAEAAKRNYGPLTPELKKLAAKVSWGVPFRDAMVSFRESIGTPLAKQASILILEAERSGGDLEQIFDAAQQHIQEILDIKRERETQIQPYIVVVYASYLIFVFVIYILFATFFETFGATAIPVNNVEVIPIPIHAFRTIFLYVLLTQGFFSGLTAGKMGSGKLKIGLIHSSVLMLIAFLAHKFLIAK